MLEHYTSFKPALVARADRVHQTEQFLQVTKSDLRWTSDSDSATCFPSLREAARMAARLPAGQRAYGVPKTDALVRQLN